MIESNNIPNDQKEKDDLIRKIYAIISTKSLLLSNEGMAHDETMVSLRNWKEDCKKGNIDLSALSLNDLKKKEEEVKECFDKTSTTLNLIIDINESLDSWKDYGNEWEKLRPGEIDEERKLKIESIKERKNQISEQWMNMEEKELRTLEQAVENDVKEMNKYFSDPIGRRKLAFMMCGSIDRSLEKWEKYPQRQWAKYCEETEAKKIESLMESLMKKMERTREQ